MVMMDQLEALTVIDLMSAHARNKLIKSTVPRHVQQRDQLIQDNLDKYTNELADYFVAFGNRISRGKIKKADGDGEDESDDEFDELDMDNDFDPDKDVNWKAEAVALSAILTPMYTQFGKVAYTAVGEQLGVDISFDLGERGVTGVMDKLAARVTDINDTTRTALADAVAAWTETGASTKSLGSVVGDIIGQWSSSSNSRASVIALTESANAYNLSSVSGYRDSGLVDEVEVMDGEDCGWTEHDDPDEADGSIRSLDDADDYPESHPNCQRSFSPVAAR